MVSDNGDKLAEPVGYKITVFKKLQHFSSLYTMGCLSSDHVLREASFVQHFHIYQGITNKMTDKNTTQAPGAPKATGWQKMLIDFGPLLVFFVSFKFGDIWVATSLFMVATVIAMIVSKILFRHVAVMLKVTFVIVMVMGGLTLYLQDETFVKMKLTFINGFFATILVVGLMRGKLYIKTVMEMALEMEDKAWRILTRNYVIFLLGMAAVNELIWRTQTTDFWVNFKTFGYMGATFIFLMTQMPMLMKYLPDEGEDKKSD